MDFLALRLPQFGGITPPANVPTGGLFSTGQDVIRTGLSFFLIIVLLLAIFYLLIGALRYVYSRGDKEKIQGAREKITYSIVGLIIAFLAFTLMTIISQFFSVPLLSKFNVSVEHKCGSCTTLDTVTVTTRAISAEHRIEEVWVLVDLDRNGDAGDKIGESKRCTSATCSWDLGKLPLGTFQYYGQAKLVNGDTLNSAKKSFTITTATCGLLKTCSNCLTKVGCMWAAGERIPLGCYTDDPAPNACDTYTELHRTSCVVNECALPPCIPDGGDCKVRPTSCCSGINSCNQSDPDDHFCEGPTPTSGPTPTGAPTPTRTPTPTGTPAPTIPPGGCSGSVSLTLNPSTTIPGGPVLPSVTGLNNCVGKPVFFKLDSCSGTSLPSSCTISAAGSGCTPINTFAAPLSSTNVFACIDKDGLNGFNDSGESNGKLLTIIGGSSPTPIPTNTPTPTPIPVNPPDLQIWSIAFVPGNPAQGQDITFEVQVANLGQSTSPNTAVRFYEGNTKPNCFDQPGLFSEVGISPLVPFFKDTKFVTKSGGFSTGPHTVWVFVDGACSISESDENNNTQSITVNVL